MADQKPEQPAAKPAAKPPAAKPAAAAAAPAADQGQDQGAGDGGEPPAAAAPLPGASAAGKKSAIRVPGERNGQQDRADAKALLFHVCEVFGVDPSADKRPEELLTWTFYPGKPVDGIPASVSIVTGGGQKLKLYEDDSLEDDTVQTLGRIFKLTPKAEGKPWTTDDLPENLTLPPVMVHGYSTSQEHVYKGGYLKSGGAKEAARRQALKKPAK